MEILLPPGRHHVAFLIGHEAKGKYFVQLHDNGQFGWILGCRQDLGLILIGLKDGLGQVGFVFGFGVKGSDGVGNIWLFVEDVVCECTK